MSKSPSFWVIGFALFSMFFGSGNLIFPVFLGASFQNEVFISACGFLISAAIIPLFGILAMIPAKGDYNQLLPKFQNKNFAKYFFFIILLFWIPLGSAPRCIILAHSSLINYTKYSIPLWEFSFVFLFLAFLCIYKKNQIINILGKFLTPALLCCIVLILVFSLSQGSFSDVHFDKKNVFFESIMEGYFTQDLIAAIFFSSSLTQLLSNEISKNKALKHTLKGGLVAIILLSLFYLLLMLASALHAEHIIGTKKDEAISALALVALGQKLGGISCLTISLACFTTEIALVLVWSDYVTKNFIQKEQRLKAIIVTLIFIWAISLIKFDPLMSIISPAMKIIYPFVLLMVIWFLLKQLKYFLPKKWSFMVNQKNT